MNSLLKRILNGVFAFCVGFCLLILPIGESAQAGKTSMTGDFAKDTISVAESLKETINLPKDEENRTSSEEEAIFLITDYISRYRNRSQVNGTVSFTTMQTALNALAGHYKNFASRPVPEKLKERVNKELSRAEALVERES